MSGILQFSIEVECPQAGLVEEIGGIQQEFSRALKFKVHFFNKDCDGGSIKKEIGDTDKL